MITALDSSVILDVLTDSPEFADASEALLRQASNAGKLIVSECVLAEICPAFKDTGAVMGFLSDWEIEFVPASCESVLLAGELFTQYLKRGGRSGRIVVDFLIGAHAQIHADRLLARDRGYLRDYFRKLTVMGPVT